MNVDFATAVSNFRKWASVVTLQALKTDLSDTLVGFVMGLAGKAEGLVLLSQSTGPKAQQKKGLDHRQSLEKGAGRTISPNPPPNHLVGQAPTKKKRRTLKEHLLFLCSMSQSVCNHRWVRELLEVVSLEPPKKLKP